jgi:hypothetical protein
MSTATTTATLRRNFVVGYIFQFKALITQADIRWLLTARELSLVPDDFN